MSKELTDFGNALGSYINSRRISVEDAMGIQGRLLMKRVAQFTPPKTLAQGRKRVRADIKKVFGLLDAKKWASKRIRKLIHEKNYAKLNQVFQHIGGRFKGIRVIPFKKEVHQKLRDRRGRIRTTKQKFVTPDVKETNEYIKKVQGNVGMAKGGWASALAHFGGKPPKYAARHASKGTFEDERKDLKSPYILFRNKSPWSGHDRADRVLKAAIKSRTRDIKKSIEAAHVFAIKKKLRGIAA